MTWSNATSEIAHQVLEKVSSKMRLVYCAQPRRIESDFNTVSMISQGDYRERQVFELIQNGADAIGSAVGGENSEGKIKIVLTKHGLYCANEGDPFTFEGIEAIAFPVLSAKRGNEIGRYGQGFKSVLAITDEPRIYSRSVSCHYSFELCTEYLLRNDSDSLERIGSISSKQLGTRDKPTVSILATPIPIDPFPFLDSDPILKELSEWASTIVHLPFSNSKKFEGRDTFEFLKKSLENFPAEFLIFAKNVKILEFEIHDQTVTSRTISCQYIDEGGIDSIDGADFRKARVAEGGGVTRDWLIASKGNVEFPNSIGKLSNQIEINRRRNPETDELLPVPISWAVPLSGQNTRGTFWLFFPTKDFSTMRGIINAPWDTNYERTAVSDTEYNKFLLSQFANLFVSAIPALIQQFPDDKGKYLDYFPGRGYEEPSAASSLLVPEVKRAMCESASLVNLEGILQKPSQMRKIHGLVSADRLEEWSTIEGTSKNFPHWSVIDPGGNRIARYNSYLDASDNSSAIKSGDLVSWLESALTNSTTENSIRALNLAKSLKSEQNLATKDEVEKAISQAKIVYCSNGKLAAPVPGVLFYSDRGVGKNDLFIVHQDLISNNSVREFLIDDFKIIEAESAVELDAILAKWPSEPVDSDWDAFWTASAILDPEDFKEVIERHEKIGAIFARSASGNFKAISKLCMPGRIFKIGEGDDDFIVDLTHHKGSLNALASMGVCEFPNMKMSAMDFPDVDGYKEYLKRNSAFSNLTEAKLQSAFERAPQIDVDLKILTLLKVGSRSRLTTWIFETFNQSFTWSFDSDKDIVDSPAFWYLKQFGLIETSLGPREFGEALSRSLVEYARVAPVSMLSAELTVGCGVRSSFSELSDAALLDIAKRLANEVDDQLIGDCLAALCRCMQAPKTIACKVRRAIESHSPTSVTVFTERDEFERISMVGLPAVLAPNTASATELANNWGLKVSESVQQEFEPSSPSEPELLSDIFFLLGERFPRRIKDVQVVRCVSLVNVIQTPEGQARNSVDTAYHENTIYVVTVGTDSNDKILNAANKHLHLNLSADDKSAINANAITQANDSKRREIRKAKSELEKIMLIYSIDQMKSALPAKLLEEIAAEADSPNVLAEMLLAVHGPQLLEKTKGLLQEIGLQPPSQWAGSRTAIKFVTELGFDRPFAGFKEPDRAAHTEVQGRIELGDLHSYQNQLKDDIKSFIDRKKKEDKWRSTLYLPTGAGKTRVTVQGILELINEGKMGNQPVLWIAQSYELCEQAVQAFTEVWSSIGTAGALSVDRFWNEKSVEQVAIPSEYAGQIVVAVDAKVSSAAVGNAEYDWLKNAALVVVDEAHRGMSRSYTKILSWLGTGVRLSRKDDLDQRPILGLSATPNTPGIEKRYGPLMIRINQKIFGEEYANDVDYLRGIGVLAIPTHELLDGVDVEGSLDDGLEGEFDEDLEDGGELDEDESLTTGSGKSRNSRQIWLPAAIEERLAENRLRNAKIIESILSLPEQCPVIVFAISVSHAQLLAALLAKNGVKSASVSSETSPSIRKLHISNFRSGKIQVLTNYGVLTTGFDAPKVEAIYITRPCFSKNVYLQMIGRGLRGPANGGTEKCLIVDIKDNFEKMNITHIYNEMGEWWSKDATDSE